METQTQYEIQVAPSTLPTLTELEALKAQYLAQGLSLFDDLALVIKEMGDFKCENAWEYFEFRDSAIRAIYLEKMGSYLFQSLNFSRTPIVTIYVGKYQVCHLILTTDPEQSTDENIYIPGKWEQRLLSRLAAAKKAVAQRELEADMSARAKLANMLLIGKEV